VWDNGAGEEGKTFLSLGPFFFGAFGAFLALASRSASSISALSVSQLKIFLSIFRCAFSSSSSVIPPSRLANLVRKPRTRPICSPGWMAGYGAGAVNTALPVSSWPFCLQMPQAPGETRWLGEKKRDVTAGLRAAPSGICSLLRARPENSGHEGRRAPFLGIQRSQHQLRPRSFH